MKVDRLIGILSVLLQQEKVTAPHLADKFEVSTRTIYRDIETLCQAGIPLVTEQGKHGGISIMEGYIIDKNLLTSSELQAVIAGLRSLDSISDNKKYRRLIEKFSPGGKDVLLSNNHILINLASWYKASLAPKIGLIQAAIEMRKQIEFQYYSPSGESFRQIEPYLLVFQWSSWYTWGFCMLRREFRLFKLNRMDQLRENGGEFEPRNVPEFKMQPEEMFHPQEVQLTAVFQKKAKWRLIEEFGIGSFREMEDGRLLMEVERADLDSAFDWLLGFGEQVEILEPQEYRSSYLKRLERMVSIYHET